MRKTIVTALTWLGIALFAWTALLFIAFNAQGEEFNDQVMDIPTKCEYKRSKVRELENQLADVMYKTWREQGGNPGAKLKDLAIYTASYVLLDNGITCRRIK